MGILLTKDVKHADTRKQERRERCARFNMKLVDIPPSDTRVIAAAAVIQDRRVAAEALRVAWVERELNDMKPERLRRSDDSRL